MNLYFHVLFLAIVPLLVHYLKIYLLRKRIVACFKCKPAPKIPLKDRFGLSNLQEQLKARQTCCWPSFLEKTLDSAGEDVHTASHRVMSQEIFYTRDPENFKAVLSAPQGDFVLGAARGGNFNSVVGSGLFTAEGERWQHYRHSARPLFNPVDTLVPWLVEDGWTKNVDMQSVFLELTLHATIAMRSTSLPFWRESSSPNPDKVAFASALDGVAAYVGNRTILGKFFWIKQSRAFRRDCKTIQDFIDARIGTTQQGKSNPHRTQAAQRSEQKEFKNQIQPFLFTGRNTTAAVITATMFFLLKNASCYRKLRAEVLQTFRAGEDIKLSNIDSCQYLNFCINESMRLASVIPAIIRSANTSFILPYGGGIDKKAPIFVPQGSTIILSIQGLHLRQDLWGSDSESFKPDRWSAYRFDWNFLPFSKVRRQCIGQQLAITQATYVIASFAQHFDNM